MHMIGEFTQHDVTLTWNNESTSQFALEVKWPSFATRATIIANNAADEAIQLTANLYLEGNTMLLAQVNVQSGDPYRVSPETHAGLKASYPNIDFKITAAPIAPATGTLRTIITFYRE